jgi:acyl CoA:acetate/3-ketoacid CoA transferase alpha subunit
MKIEELVSGKKDGDEVTFDSVSLPVSVLKKLIKDGYSNLKFYSENKTFSLWGKNCTACFTEQQIRERK